MVSCAAAWAAETTGEGGRAKLGSSGPRGSDWSRAAYLGEAVISQDVLKFKRGWCPHAAARVRSP